MQEEEKTKKPQQRQRTLAASPDQPAATQRRTTNTQGAALLHMQEDFLGAQRCPKCGTLNDATATFCENCGEALHDICCPNCGAKVEPDADFCENCHSYIGKDRCSFCNAPMSETDEFCMECGAPRKGLICPTCHTLSHFPFCERCGTPLTDTARREREEAWKQPIAEEVRQLERELEELWRTKPVLSKQERAHRERIRELRDRVLKLLHEAGSEAYSGAPVQRQEPTYLFVDELRTQTEQKRMALQALLDKMEMPQMTNPAIARTVSMAQKPHISRLAWRCNYKQALHPSPLACACPQMGGKWIVLGGGEEKLISDHDGRSSK